MTSSEPPDSPQPVRTAAMPRADTPATVPVIVPDFRARRCTVVLPTDCSYQWTVIRIKVYTTPVD
ncbi:hypothetical protein Saso_34370 [Streptomyces asoensis]|uniref:Uncharacterized protein n=1 Tax=Streptomyces asoensis TaxID=249586 RepID=A0ABQ3S1C2_9ACTN|nr:hypothetical protein GCM10010496_27720 [Streptomyces asoensis]GHI61787.1 hypothetical protein Saso_34370 [Streptomyces asoensis]